VLRTKTRLFTSKVKKVDASINYINSRCYQYQELRDIPLNQLSKDAFDYIVNTLLYKARIDGDANE